MNGPKNNSNQSRCFIVARTWGVLDSEDGVVTQAADGRYIATITRMFDQADVAIVCVTPDEYGFVNDYNFKLCFEKNRRIRPLVPVITGNYTKKIKAWYKNLWLVFDGSRGADVMFVFMASGLAAFAAIVARLRGQRVFLYSGIDWTVNTKVETANNNPLLHWLKVATINLLENWAMRSAHIRLFNGESLVRRYSTLPGKTEKTKPVTMLSTIDARPPSGATLKVPLRLIYIGAVIPRKNYETLFRAMAMLRRRGYDAQLHVVGAFGEDTYINELKLLQNELHLNDAVSYIGYITDQCRLINVLRESHLFVLCSLNEGFPRAVWEAMLQGLPCVVSDIPNIRDELGDRMLCVYCDPKQPESIADAIISLVNDPQLYQKLARNGYDYALSIFSETWESQLQRLLTQLRD